MHISQNLQVSKPLAIATLAALLIALLLTCVTGQRAVSKVRDGQAASLQRAARIEQLVEIDRLLSRCQLLAMDMLVDPWAESVKRLDLELRTSAEAVNELWNAVVSAGLPQEAAPLAQAFAQHRDAYVGNDMLRMRDAARAGHADEALRIYATTVSPSGARLSELVAMLVAGEVDHARRDQERVNAAHPSAIALGAAVLAGGLLFAAMLTLLVVFTAGRRDQPAAEVPQVREPPQSIASRSPSDPLVHPTTDASQMADELLGRTHDVTAGANALADIARLVDSIAFQTKTVSLNAVIEAARVGEQGRGFAALAGELHSTAQRAADAAEQIRRVEGDLSDAIARLEHVARRDATLIEQSAATSERLHRKAAWFRQAMDGLNLDRTEPSAHRTT
jgi:hypothetical protein